jgi:hypothetical protein
MKTKTTKTARLLKGLADNDLTIAQIRTRYGVANPTAAISYARNELGYDILSYQTKSGVTKYNLAA